MVSLALEEFGKAKVSETDVAICIHQYILGLQISVDNALLVEIAKSEDDLSSNELDSIFLEPLLLVYIVVNVSTWQVFEEEVDSELVLEDEIHRVHEWVLGLEKNVLFVFDVLDLLLLE